MEWSGRLGNARPLESKAFWHGNPLGDPHVPRTARFTCAPLRNHGERLPCHSAAFRVSRERPFPLFERHPMENGAPCCKYDAGGKSRRSTPRRWSACPTLSRAWAAVNSSTPPRLGAYQDPRARKRCCPSFSGALPGQAPDSPRRHRAKAQGVLARCTCACKAQASFRAAASIAGDCHFEYCFGGRDADRRCASWASHDSDPQKIHRGTSLPSRNSRAMPMPRSTYWPCPPAIHPIPKARSASTCPWTWKPEPAHCRICLATLAEPSIRCKPAPKKERD